MVAGGHFTSRMSIRPSPPQPQPVTRHIHHQREPLARARDAQRDIARVFLERIIGLGTEAAPGIVEDLIATELAHAGSPDIPAACTGRTRVTLSAGGGVSDCG